MSSFRTNENDILKWTKKKKIDKIIKHLNKTSRTSSYARDAATALGQLGDRRAVEPLISALGDGDGDVRFDETRMTKDEWLNFL
jgi:HEAT repeat protein